MNKIMAIERDHCPTCRSRISKDLSIVPTLLTGFLHSENIVPEQPELFHDRVGEVLIRVQACHAAHAFSF